MRFHACGGNEGKIKPEPQNGHGSLAFRLPLPPVLLDVFILRHRSSHLDVMSLNHSFLI